MANFSKSIGVLAAVGLLAGHAGAEIEGQVGAGYHTDYIFRGAQLGRDLTDAAVDFGADAAGLALSAGAWYGSSEEGFGGDQLDEFRLYGEAAKALGAGVDGRIGYLYYQRDADAFRDTQQELYFGLGYELPFYGIIADLTYYWDTKGDNDGYIELGLSKHIDLTGEWSLDLGGQLGYLAENGGLSHAVTKAALNYKLSETATLSGYVAHVWELDELEDAVYAQDNGRPEEDRVIGGVGITVGF